MCPSSIQSDNSIESYRVYDLLQTDRHFRKNHFFWLRGSHNVKIWWKFPVIFHIKLIPSQPWWECKKWKNAFYCAKTAPNSALNRRSVVIFDRLWANAATISNRAFSCSNFYAKCWIHYFMISSRWQLSHATSIYGRPKSFFGLFLYFLEQLPNMGDQRV